MASILRPFRWFYHEFGLASIHGTGRNAYLIILARTCRTFAYGTNALILALFFAELNFSDSQIGLFMTLTLLGEVLLGTALTLIADRVGRRKILFAGSFLMVLSGVFFAVFENFWLLLFAAVVGVISATGGDFGPFRAIEESILSQLTTPATRSDVLAWYVTISAWGSSLGSEASGRFIDNVTKEHDWTLASAYHAIFWVYAIFGLVNASLVLLLTNDCEANQKTDEAYSQVPQADDEQEIELAESPTDSNAASVPGGPVRRASGWRSWLTRFGDSMSSISKPTRQIMYKLWALLAVDSLADGMVPLALTNYYMDNKFHPSKATLGDITSIGYFLAAFSAIFAGPLAKKLGLINTMVFTHVPSSTAVLLFPLPSVLWMTIVLFFTRMGLNNMDQAPRAAFIAAVVKADERTAVIGLTSTLRTLTSATGPMITGVLANGNRFWIAFVAAGAFRLTYDFGLYAMFVNMKLYQHEQKGPEMAAVEQRDRLADEEMADPRHYELDDDDDDDDDSGDDFGSDSTKSTRKD